MLIKQKIKSAFRRVAPNTLDVIQAIRARRLVNRLQEQWGIAPLTREFVTHQGLTVRRGPFAGLQFGPRITWSNLVSKLVGCYEAELLPEWQQLARETFDTVIDVGCADGYYAVGMARLWPAARVIAFDIDPLSRSVVNEMAQLNGVADRLAVRGRCTPAALADLLQGRSFVLSDCEGYESVLIDPRAVPALRHTRMIVELHEDTAPGIHDLLNERFQQTHEIMHIAAVPVTHAPPYPELSCLSEGDRVKVLREARPAGNDWISLTPHGR